MLFVLGLGSHYVNKANWGTDWHSFAPFGVGGIGLAAGLVFFSYIGFDAVSTTAQEAKNPQRDLPIGIIVSLSICTLLYIGVAAVLTGMVPWREVNIEAPIVAGVPGPQPGVGREYRDHRRAGRADERDAGDVAGPEPGAVLDGARWAAAEEVLRRYSSQVPDAVEGNDSCRAAGGDCWERHADRRYRQDGEHRDAAGVCDRVHRGDRAAADRSGPGEAVPDAVCAVRADTWHSLQRIHDVQAGHLELDSADRVADYRAGCLLHLQPKTQHAAAKP